tara:strand:+ start:116 stop:706 length:591 start_codon:yes stop_codon:yes gene_type:complete
VADNSGERPFGGVPRCYHIKRKQRGNIMQIYVSCLAAYNNGFLHGKWIEPTSDIEEMEIEVAKVIKSSPVPDAEEYAIQDYDGFPDLGEYPGLQKICDFVEMVEGSDLDADIVSAVVDEFPNDLGTAQHVLDENYGIHNSFQDYADEFADEMMACHNCGNGEWIKDYFDYDKHADAISHDYIRIDVKGGVLIALNR